jgi:hypothetical protein
MGPSFTRLSAVTLVIIGLMGCEGKTSPTSATAPASPPAVGQPAPTSDNLIQATAAIEAAPTVDGFPRTLLVTCAVTGDLHWNNEAKPLTLTLKPPPHVKLSKTTVVIPNPETPVDSLPRTARVGLDEDDAQGDDWSLSVDLEGYVCYTSPSVCLRRIESHVIKPTRG